MMAWAPEKNRDRYGDYLEQLTYLLFLKMADEYSRPPHNRKMRIPKAFNWEILITKSGDTNRWEIRLL